MSEIKNKKYDINGMLLMKDKTYWKVPMVVIVTSDKTGCTVSIGCEDVDLMMSVPFDKMLKDLEET